MRDLLHDLGAASAVVLSLMCAVRYARGWRLRWVRREEER